MCGVTGRRRILSDDALRKIAGCVLSAALALFCISSIVFMLRTEFVSLFSLDEAGYGESYILYDIISFQHTGLIYRDPAQPPYLPAQYSPLVYMLYSLPDRIITLGNPFIGPRLLVITTFFLSVLVAVSIVRVLLPVRFASSWGLLLAMSIVGFHDGGNWVVQVRGDFPGILFGLLAVRLLLARARYAVLLAGLCAGLAIEFKITFVAALAAGFMWLLSQKRWSDLAIFIAAGTSTALGLYLLFWLREPRMLSQMTALSPGIADLGGWSRLVFRVIREPVFLLSLLGLPPVASRPSRRWSLLLLFAAISFGVAALTDIHAGGNINYFFDGLLALVPAAVLGVFRLTHWASQRPTVAVFLAAVVLLYLVPLRDYIESWPSGGGYDVDARNNRFRDLQNALAGQHIFSAVPRLALLDPDPALTEPYLWSYMERLGKFDPQPILRRLANNEFDVVITPLSDEAWRGVPRVAPDLRRAITESYKPECRTMGVAVYIPRWRPEDANLMQALSKISCAPLSRGGASGTLG